jgi:HD superfamily phosphohydrolase
MPADLAAQYPRLEEVTQAINGFLAAKYPEYFGPDPKHPNLPLRPSKVIHDNLWGTNVFDWRELAVIDSPIFQRLRNIHQTGLAYFVYPCAHHMRFEHSLGVCVMASRVFDALLRQHEKKLRGIAKEIHPEGDFSKLTATWRAELRLAALLHDTGHSLHSHTSEIVYSNIPLLREAAKELTNFAGEGKGVGEVLSFCISRTPAVLDILARARAKVVSLDEDIAEIDPDNVSLLIIGRSKYPQLQFLGDIISSDLDADKLDYLLRDATAAGLPLRYDLERYLYTVDVSQHPLADGEARLRKLYETFGVRLVPHDPTPDCKYPFYPGYKLRLPRQATNTIEQIIICKFMLFSYIYHHKKVRAAEGMLARLIRRRVLKWRSEGKDDTALIAEFLGMTDHALDGATFKLEEPDIEDYRHRIVNRLIPREVVGLTSSIDHPESAKLSSFMSDLLKNEKLEDRIKRFEYALAKRLIELRPELGQDPESAIVRAGVWFDVPKAPNFNKLEELLIGASKDRVAITMIFPVTSWIQAYISYRYHVRVFSFSEYLEAVADATQYACKEVIGINDPNFIRDVRKARS